MDIDDFLEKELGKVERQNDQASIPRSAEAEALTSNVASLLQNRQFDQVEETYGSLWKRVSQMGLAWDKGIHQELIAINAQLEREMALLYRDFGKKAQVVQQMLSQSKSFLDARETDSALKLFDEASSLVDELPSILFSEKKAMEREMLRIQRDIHEAKGRDAQEKAAVLSKQIAEQISRLRPFLRSGNIPLASGHYSRLLSLYSQIPQGFLSLKVSMGKELAEVYKTLAIEVEIENLKNQLHPLHQQRVSSAPSLRTREIIERNRKIARAAMPAKKYDEALKAVQAILALSPGDEEAKAIVEKVQSAKRVMPDGF